MRCEVAVVLWPRLYEPDYSKHVAALVEAKPEIVVNGHWGGDLLAFIKQARTFQLFDKVQFANFDAGGHYEVMAELGADMPAGLILSARHHNNWPDTRANRRFVKAFRPRPHATRPTRRRARPGSLGDGSFHRLLEGG